MDILGAANDLVFNLRYGKPTPAQYSAIVDKAARDDPRYKAGKITLAEAITDVRRDMDKIIAMNNADAERANLLNPIGSNGAILLAALGFGALLLITRGRQ